MPPTIIETPTFQKQAGKLWSSSEQQEFIDWIAVHPASGRAIPGVGGARQVRWRRTLKSCEAKIIYFHLPEDHALLLVAVYAKAALRTSGSSPLEMDDMR
ncbi:DNA-binding protein [Bordetella avium]|uniref:DNA-binding protein n=1 Tax=Bordetella avium TaxID=521 RepID=UPI000E0C70D3|nr:DNA-binding protein [Bordetella avium]RIQ14132.1 DNA-binding protein [Bordetella avium]RIQ57205.1 DNA-binding protein [Bordetella avium]RIQ66256.1 DNA-binding protein [Bordetella avium]RIQ66938.1 DNA-binding protein [Bordetella avium]RIQ79990.1 DNA-binding protein [Bordetella avium]